MKDKQKKVEVEITTTDKLSVSTTEQASGWGEDAQTVAVRGAVANIVVQRDGKSEFGIRILEDGSIILTS